MSLEKAERGRPTLPPSRHRASSIRAPIQHVDSFSVEPDALDEGPRGRHRSSDETLHEEEENAERVDLEEGGRGIERVLSFRPKPLPARRHYPDDIVTFEGPSDPDNARNFSTTRKAVLVALFGSTTAGSQFCSSILSSGSTQISAEFGVSEEAVVLVTSLYVLPYALGPILWGPLSEQAGRRISILIPYFAFICLTAGAATTDRFSSLLVLRFFGGLTASAPVTTVGGGLADLYNAENRGAAVVAYSFAVVAGPCLGPIVGAAFALDPATLGWRFSLYITILITGLVFVADLLFLSETFAASILTSKARKLRLKTGNYALHSRQEMSDLSIPVFVEKHLTLPILMVFRDPIVTSIAAYNAFCYSIVYDLFVAIPFTFQQHRGWSPLLASLPFLGVMLGCIIAGCINIYWSNFHYAPAVRANDGQAQPEKRLPPMLLGALTLPIGCFWFAWTSNAHWINQVLALVGVGASFLLIFQSGINYLLDSYETQAASAVAANTILRSLTASLFPLWVLPSLKALGIHWAVSVQGFASVALAFVPLIFIRYGKQLRAKSRYAAAPASLKEKA